MFCPFSQNVLLQLSCAGFRKLVHDLDFAWDHELANVALVLCPRYEVFRLEALAFLDCHVGLWTFTPGFFSAIQRCQCQIFHSPMTVRNRDDGSLQKIGMLNEHALEGYR